MHPLNGTKSLLQALLIGHLFRRVRKTAGVSASVGPRSVGHRLPLAVHVDRIHPLVEKAEQAAVLTPTYNWLILVFGEPQRNLPSSALVKQVLDR